METLKDKRIAIIGAGNIGKMLLNRLCAMGVSAQMISVCDVDPQRAKAATASVGSRVFELADPSSSEASVWLLCTGPKTILPVLQSLAPWLKSGQVVISFAAAVPMTRLEALVPEGVNLVRVMPNMPSMVGCGMNPVCFSEKSTPEARALVMELLTALGKTIEVRDDQMNWSVGLCGAAMRSVLPLIEGMIRAGTEAGLSAADARLIATQVVMGTAELVKQTTLSLPEIKNLTPMEILDEALLERMVYEAAAGAKKKIDGLQEKIIQE